MLLRILVGVLVTPWAGGVPWRGAMAAVKVAPTLAVGPRVGAGVGGVLHLLILHGTERTRADRDNSPLGVAVAC